MRSRISHLLYLLVNYVLLVEFLVILNHKDFFLNFMHWLKSAILAIFQFWQNGTFELVHEIKIVLPERLLLKRYEDGIYRKYS